MLRTDPWFRATAATLGFGSKRSFSARFALPIMDADALAPLLDAALDESASQAALANQEDAARQDAPPRLVKWAWRQAFERGSLTSELRLWFSPGRSSEEARGELGQFFMEWGARASLIAVEPWQCASPSALARAREWDWARREARLIAQSLAELGAPSATARL